MSGLVVMIRILLLIGLIYLFFKGRRAWLDFKQSVHENLSAGNGPEQINDIMVQDPFCKVYFPRNEGVRLRHKGEYLIFCSEECRQKFIDHQRS